MFCDNYKMRTVKTWISMAQRRVVKGASSLMTWTSILRKVGWKSMRVREENLEPSRNKVGQNRDL
jgi:hypothetical protein